MEKKMKNSGIEWVGEIPDNWEISRLKYLFTTVSGNGFNIDLQGEEGGDYPFCKASDISVAKKVLYKAQNYVTKQLVKLNRYNIIPTGSIIFAKIGEAMKKNNRAICQCDCCIDNNCQALIPLSNILSAFAFYILKCVDMQWFDNAGTIPCISVKKLMNSSIVFPPLSEQKAIAEFLDKKCGEVDALIADIQQEIETLEQYKRSVITEAVTKGLDPSVPMIDSGIDYLGRINSEWCLTKLGYICQKLNRPVPEKAEALICSNKGKVVLREDVSVGLISENDRMYQGVKVGDLCIHGMDTWHGAIAVSSLNGKITTVVHCCDSREDKRFIAYYLQMLAFKKVYKAISNGVRGNTSDFRSWDKAGDIYIVLPNKETQQQIADYLDKKCKEIEGVIAEKQSQIETLESYKKSLIYEYVTGKKEVIA